MKSRVVHTQGGPYNRYEKPFLTIWMYVHKKRLINMIYGWTCKSLEMLTCDYLLKNQRMHAWIKRVLFWLFVNRIRGAASTLRGQLLNTHFYKALHWYTQGFVTMEEIRFKLLVVPLDYQKLSKICSQFSQARSIYASQMRWTGYCFIKLPPHYFKARCLRTSKKRFDSVQVEVFPNTTSAVILLTLSSRKHPH